MRPLVGVVHVLGLAVAEPAEPDRRVAVAVGGHKPAVQVRHRPHQPVRLHRQPVSTGIQPGYVSGSSLVKLARTGVPLCATTAIPNEPACPASPDPSS